MSPQHGTHHRRPCFTTGGSVKLIPQERAKNLEVEQIVDLIDVIVIRQGQVPVAQKVEGTAEVVKLAPQAGASHREDGAASSYAGSAYGDTCQASSCSEGMLPCKCSFPPVSLHRASTVLTGNQPKSSRLSPPRRVSPIMCSSEGCTALTRSLAATSCKCLPHVKRRCLHARTLSTADTSMQTHSADVRTDICV